jgi:WD40 repeat protein/serine/threonine protein kinase
MLPTHSSERPNGWQELEDLLDRFEEAWQQQTPPRIEDFFLPSRSSGKEVSARARQLFLEELIKIDLGHRWRRKGTAGQPLALEDYVARFPHLGQGNGLDAELIGEEYRVRQLWGDRPGHDEYVTRFSRPGSKLRETLLRIDKELAAELAPGQIAERASQALFTPQNHPELIQPIASVDTLIDSLRRLPLLSADQVNELASAHTQNRFSQPRDLGRELVMRGWLTPYQVNQLLMGRGPELVVGPYLLLERLGEGGTGQVFKARHQRMDRMVALKVIRKELLSDSEVIGRFYREIQAISQLTHPHIVHAYDAGPVGATHFLAMEFVEGTDLGKCVKQSGPLPVAVACDYIRQAAIGLQYAHERGLVHRDIKPSNLLLSKPDPQGTGLGLVKILDMGLARLRPPVDEKATTALADGRTGSTLTPVGAVMMMGTPDYLAPEQALDFHGADIRADIYSLGCTFFYLLTGEPPFPGGTVPQKLLQHQQTAPPALAKFRSDPPAGLPAVLNKMLAKRPDQRFQRPLEVITALEKILENLGATLPDSSRPGFIWPLFSRGTSRPRRLYLGIGGALLALLILILGMKLFKGTAPLPSARTTGDERFAWQPPELVETRGEFRQRHWGTVTCLAVSPTEQWVASGGGDQIIRLWDPQTMREQHVLRGHTGEILSLAFSPDGKRLASGARDLSVRLWDLSAKLPGPTWITGDVGRAFAVAFAPNGRLLATAGDDKTVRLWDISGKEPKAFQTLPGHTDTVCSLAFAPNSKWLVSAGADKAIRIWELTDKGFKAGPVLTKHTGRVLSVAYAPNGLMLASAGDDRTVRLWDLQAAEPREVYLMADQFDELITSESASRGRLLAFAPGGRTLAVAGKDRTVRTWQWNGTQATEQHVLTGHNAWVSSVMYFPDSKKLISGGYDGTVRLWDLAANKPQESFELKGYPCLVTAAAFDKDSRKLVCGNAEGATILWDCSLGGSKTETAFKGSPRGAATALALCGQQLAVGSTSDTIVTWDLTPEKRFPGPSLHGHRSMVNALAFSPDGRRLVSGSSDKTVRIWDLQGAKPSPVGEPRENSAEILSVACSPPDGQRLASAGLDGTVRWWNLLGDKLSLVQEVKGRGPLAISSDGAILATAGTDNDKGIHLWDLREGKLKGRCVLQGNLNSAPVAMAFTSDGRTFAGANISGQVFVWDLASERILKNWQLPGAIRALAFTADNQYLITANVNNTACIFQLSRVAANANP